MSNALPIHTLVSSLSLEEFMSVFQGRAMGHRLWRHPFLERIRHGDYTFDDLRMWAIQAGHVDQIFAEVLGRMIQNPSIAHTHRAPLIDNLQDELGHGVPEQEHFTLFRDVLKLCNVSEETYNATGITSGTQGILDLLLTSASDTNNPLRTVTLMANEELLCPNEFPIFVDAFQQFAADEYSLRYFAEHINADVGHSEDLMRIVYNVALQQGAPLDEVFRYQDEDLETNWLFYEDMFLQGT